MKKVFTTGEVADHCGVNFRTVIRWIERGHLHAYKLPGRGDNRVPLESFLRFLKENHMPIPQEFQASVAQPRVLIVDDDDSMSRAIERVLKNAGFETCVATDGFEAGSLAITFAPTIITLDLQMPGINGFQVITFLRIHTALPQVKILVVSAMPDDQLHEALNEGADGVLSKPFDNDVLIEKVSNLAKTET